jgi:hypothetical protein
MLFRTSARPLQQDYWDWLDSYFHKEDKIPVSNVENLETTLSTKAGTEDVSDLSESISSLENRLADDNFNSTSDARLTGRSRNGAPIYRLDACGTVLNDQSNLFSVDFPYEKLDLVAGEGDNYPYEVVSLYGILVRDSTDVCCLSGGSQMVFDLDGLWVCLHLYGDGGIKLDKDLGGNFDGCRCYLTMEFVLK